MEKKAGPGQKRDRSDGFFVVDGGVIEVAKKQKLVENLVADEITIAGRVKGTVYARTRLEIRKSGVVEGAIKCCGEVVIAGRVEGDVWADSRLEIRPEGRLEGAISSPKADLAQGCFFKGKLTMAGKGKAFPESAFLEMREQIGGRFPRDDRPPRRSLWSKLFSTFS